MTATTMRAAVLEAIGRPLALREVPIPRPGPGEALIRTETCGICRTDLHIQEGRAYVPHLPHISGHEPAGVVAAVGDDVPKVTLGARVVPHLFVHGRECHYTRWGQQAQARDCRGILGVTLPGGFAEYFLAPARNLLVLPREVTFAAGGLASCAAVTAVHAFRKARPGLGETALVLGAGGIGLILVQLLVSAGARVIAVDPAETAQRLARDQGAFLALAPGDDATSRILAACHADVGGVDMAFDLVGTAASVALGARCVRAGGKLVVIGEEAETPPLDTTTIAQRELQILGSRNGGLGDMADALEWMARGVIRPVIAGVFPLEQINEALELVRQGRATGRVIIEPRTPTPTG